MRIFGKVAKVLADGMASKDVNEAINAEVNHVTNGDLVEDLVTGFQGVVLCTTTWLHGCDRIEVAPRELDDGKVAKAGVFDIMRCKLIEKGVIPVVQPNPAFLNEGLPLGAAAKDKMTGWEGMITGRAVTFSGSVEIVLEAEKLDEKGKPKEAQFFHAERIEVVEVKPIPVAEGAPLAKTGGPQDIESGFGRNR